MCIKYINCMILPYITSIATAVLYLISSKLASNGTISQGQNFLFLGLTSIYEITTNIIFLHLQFDYMNTCYMLLCNPCRIEIKHVFINQLSKINIDIISSETKTTKDRSTDTDTITTTSTYSIPPPSGMEPTKSGNNINTNKLEPDSTSAYPDITGVHKIYLCKICPFHLHS